MTTLLAIFVTLVFCYSLTSGKPDGTVITGPILFAAAGAATFAALPGIGLYARSVDGLPPDASEHRGEEPRRSALPGSGPWHISCGPALPASVPRAGRGEKRSIRQRRKFSWTGIGSGKPFRQRMPSFRSGAG